MLAVCTCFSGEQAIEQTEEERYHDEQHQSREIAQHQNEHEAALDPTGSVQTPGALRRAEPISVIAKHDERPASEIAGAFEVGRDRSECRQPSDGRLTRERPEERRTERI